MNVIVNIHGYAFDASRAAILSSSGSVFCARSLGRGRPWLRFVTRSDGDGWFVTAHKTKREATEGRRVVRDPAGRFPAWLLQKPGVKPSSPQAVRAVAIVALCTLVSRIAMERAR